MNLLWRPWIWLRNEVSPHYGERELLAFQDGEMAAYPRRRIAAHLERCGVCQSRVAYLEEELKFLAAIDAVSLADQPSAVEAVAGVQKAIRDWNAGIFRENKSQSAGFEPNALCPEMCAELAFYLGPHAVDLIYRESIHKAYSRKELLQKLESILQDLLGYQATQSLAEKLPSPMSFESCRSREGV